MNQMFLSTLKPVIILVVPLVYIAILVVIDKMLVRDISKETLENWHNNPAYWKNDAIYRNPADPRLFPPKKIKAMGWTINVANRWSIASLVFLLVLIFTGILFI